MTQAGSKGFDVTMTTFSTPLDYTAMASLIKNDLSQIGINVNIVPQDPVTFGAKNSAGDFDWDLTGRGMRGDVDGYVAEFNPVSPTARPCTRSGSRAGTARRAARTRSRSGASSATAASRSTRRSGCRCTRSSTRLLIDELVEVPLVSVSKFFVVNKRLKNIYVAFTDFNPALRTAYVVS